MILSPPTPPGGLALGSAAMSQLPPKSNLKFYLQLVVNTSHLTTTK